MIKRNKTRQMLDLFNKSIDWENGELSSDLLFHGSCHVIQELIKCKFLSSFNCRDWAIEVKQEWISLICEGSEAHCKAPKGVADIQQWNQRLQLEISNSFEV